MRRFPRHSTDVDYSKEPVPFWEQALRLRPYPESASADGSEPASIVGLWVGLVSAPGNHLVAKHQPSMELGRGNPNINHDWLATQFGYNPFI
jgi:hypothetical protein